jgi:site-specific DNA-methyltransferase (adenine-specific)
MIAWVYGSGFPKSLDVSKAIDKIAGAEGEIVAERRFWKTSTVQASGWNDNAVAATGRQDVRAPATDAAKQWQGWGTALKPALEPITVARKPLGEKTVAANVLEHGTGAINVDGCRVGTETIEQRHVHRIDGGKGIGAAAVGHKQKQSGAVTTSQGRWPANLIHDGSDEVMGLFPVTTSGGSNGTRKAGPYSNERTWSVSETPGTSVTNGLPPDTGSAARFFYCAKASKKDRDEGCEGLEAQNNMRVNGPRESEEAKHATKRTNFHPTVKPTALMRYLCRLVTPPEGIVLDPFMGSGSTGKAALLEGFRFIGIERDKEYMKIAEARIKAQKCD